MRRGVHSRNSTNVRYNTMGGRPPPRLLQLVDVRPGLYQRPQAPFVPTDGSLVERRALDCGFGVHSGPSLDKRTDNLFVSVLRRAVQRRHLVVALMGGGEMGGGEE